jgi:hypothetical protein
VCWFSTVLHNVNFGRVLTGKRHGGMAKVRYGELGVERGVW